MYGASWKGHIDALNFLLTKGATENVVTNKGNSPLSLGK